MRHDNHQLYRSLVRKYSWGSYHPQLGEYLGGFPQQEEILIGWPGQGVALDRLG